MNLDIGVIAECVTHHYQDEHGKFRWHCIVCDDGSNKHGRHPRGHKLESDAMCGARMHARDKYRHRLQRAQLKAWTDEMHSTQDPERFRKLWEWRWPGVRWREDWTMQECMDDFRANYAKLSGS